MTSKTTQAYEEFFYEICKYSVENKVNLNPQHILSDFENASINACKSYFPNAEFSGCYFHFGNIIWRRIQNQGIYVKDENFAMKIRMFKA